MHGYFTDFEIKKADMCRHIYVKLSEIRKKCVIESQCLSVTVMSFDIDRVILISYYWKRVDT